MVAVINYVLNATSENPLDVDSAIVYIVSTIESNKDWFEYRFSMTDVRSGMTKDTLRISRPAPNYRLPDLKHATFGVCSGKGRVYNMIPKYYSSYFYTVDINASNFDLSNEQRAPISLKLIVGVVSGTLSLIGVAGLVVGLVVYSKKGKMNYEKLPLLADE